MMPVSHDFFLKIAKESIESSGENWSRNAISRAYYHMFHTTTALIGGQQNIPDTDGKGNKLTGGTHKRFCDYLCDGDAARDFFLDPVLTKEAGMKLKAAHHQRVIADYRLQKHVHRYTANSVIEDAENQIAKVEAILLSKTDTSHSA
ncbi:hypothetical protein [Pantoea agglomerans]|jgi:uncharacterized protein (UPF0332 family)|uniref:hypothetical protein n=1 Tax=Enterobacter agglomerans TaxID=549 RepID=UPI003209BABE